jgi:hypothetical protein
MAQIVTHPWVVLILTALLLGNGLSNLLWGSFFTWQLILGADGPIDKTSFSLGLLSLAAACGLQLLQARGLEAPPPAETLD